jgi:hypothetical protein
MRFEHLAREFRRRAAALPAPLRAAAIDEATGVLVESACMDRNEEREAVRRMVGALAQVFRHVQADEGLLDSLTPETICRLDHFVNALRETGCSEPIIERALEPVHDA